MKILNFGSCNIDLVYSVGSIVCPGETIAATALNRYPGGKGLNQSVALARAGAPVYHAGCIGEDGDFLLNYMKDSGVDLTHLYRTADSTGQAFIQVAECGENSIVVYHGANYAVTRATVDEVLGAFSAGDILLLQNEISEVEYIIERAHALGMKIFLNPSPLDEKIKSIDLNKIYCLIVNSHEAEGFATEYTADESAAGAERAKGFIGEMRRKHPALTAVVTLGSSGAVWFDSEREVFQPSFKVRAVDTTGAGDTFTGYFLASFARGESIEAALYIASLAASVAVSREGAASSIPKISELGKML